MLRYAITSRSLFPGSDAEQRAAVLDRAARWATDGIDFIQLRERDLTAAALSELTRKMVKAIAPSGQSTKLLVHSRPDVAIATGAHGVHLTGSAGELTPAQVRALFAAASMAAPAISISCHTMAEVVRARDHHVDAILFSPVFEKPLPDSPSLPGQGLDRLRQACAAAAPAAVFALGGVTPENTPACLEAGAVGVAGIRLFRRVYGS